MRTAAIAVAALALCGCRAFIPSEVKDQTKVETAVHEGHLADPPTAQVAWDVWTLILDRAKANGIGEAVLLGQLIRDPEGDPSATRAALTAEIQEVVDKGSERWRLIYQDSLDAWWAQRFACTGDEPPPDVKARLEKHATAPSE